MKPRLELVLGLVLATFLAGATYFCLLDLVTKQSAVCSAERIDGAVTLDGILTLEDARSVQESCLQGATDEGLRSRRMVKIYTTGQSVEDIAAFYDTQLLPDGWWYVNEGHPSYILPKSAYESYQLKAIQSAKGFVYEYDIWPDEMRSRDRARERDRFLSYQLRLTTKPTSGNTMLVQLELFETARYSQGDL